MISFVNYNRESTSTLWSHCVDQFGFHAVDKSNVIPYNKYLRFNFSLGLILCNKNIDKGCSDCFIVIPNEIK